MVKQTQNNMKAALSNEIALLHRAEAEFKVPAAPVIRQLRQWYDAMLPDRLPEHPAWTTFQWPASGEVNFSAYWKDVDRGAWRGEYL